MTGSGPPLVLLHGVGFGPETFGVLARMAAPLHTVITPHRPGYGASRDLAIPTSVADQTSLIVATIESLGSPPVTVIGVSGGATIALDLAMRAPRLVARCVVHEPAVGPLAPTLAHTLTSAAADLRAADDPTGPALALARSLAGERLWDRRADLVARARDRAHTIAREVPGFAAFAPSAQDLARLRAGDVVSSRGTDSGPPRVEVSARLHELAGAVEALTEGGHLAQIEAPHDLLALVQPTGVRL